MTADARPAWTHEPHERPPPTPTERSLAMINERLTELEAEVANYHKNLGDVMAKAIVQGVSEVLNNEQLMDSMLERLLGALSRRSTKVAGRVTLDLLKEIPRKMGYFLVAGVIVYNVGGWQALAGFVKTLFASKAV